MEKGNEFKVKWFWMDVKDIKRNPKNPRIIKDRKFRHLVKSIKEFPEMLQIRPVVVDDNDFAIGGDKRLLAAIEAKLQKIPVVKASNLTEKQREEFIIKDNLHSGEWDDTLLKDWDKMLLADWGLDTKTGKEDEIGTNCEYPLIPQFDEKYTSVVIICETKTELASLKSTLGISGKRQSYKQKYLGETNVVKFKEVKLK